MSKLSSKLRLATGNRIHFWCPGCKRVHGIDFGEGPGPRWIWNNDVDNPTFTPSLLIQSGHYIDGNNKECWCIYNQKYMDDNNFKCIRCHSFITNGKIHFLSDCSHELAGQTIDIPDYPSDLE